MDREKKQQIALLVLIPLFLLSLIYTRMQKASQTSKEGIDQEEASCKDARINEISLPSGDLDTEYELFENDPLKNLLQLYLYKTRVVKAEEKIIIPLPELAIEGIIWNTYMPQAIVDGKIVRVGDIIKNAEIVGIEKSGIIVFYNGEKVLIKR